MIEVEEIQIMLENLRFVKKNKVINSEDYLNEIEGIQEYLINWIESREG